MNWLEALVALLLLASGILALIGALGLWRLPDYFLRMHAPALAASIATYFVTFASIAYFSARAGAPVLSVWSTSILLAITAPVTAMLLARAALFRRRAAGDPLPPPLGRR